MLNALVKCSCVKWEYVCRWLLTHIWQTPSNYIYQIHVHYPSYADIKHRVHIYVKCAPTNICREWNQHREHQEVYDNIQKHGMYTGAKQHIPISNIKWASGNICAEELLSMYVDG